MNSEDGGIFIFPDLWLRQCAHQRWRTGQKSLKILMKAQYIPCDGNDQETGWLVFPALEVDVLTVVLNFTTKQHVLSASCRQEKQMQPLLIQPTQHQWSRNPDIQRDA